MEERKALILNRMVNRENDKKWMIIFGITFAIALIVFIGIFVSLNNQFKATSDLGLLTVNTTESIVPNDTKNTLSVSFSQDKTVNQVENKQITSGITVNTEAAPSASTDLVTISEKSKDVKQAENIVDEPEIKKELAFMAPVVGEIITDYADESLVYSKTLDEWTTHLGIDIKANKTSSVVASEEGTVKAVKNDPRYGLTVIIAHEDGYETLYANLLSADFVKEGEKVAKNQTIGTIGESASFEISDPPHLHFEILKNGENVNPTTVIK